MNIPSQVDTTKAIWERLYLVRVPSLDATSMSFLKMHGTYITGIKSIDDANVNNWMTTYINIAQMVDFYKEGVTVAVVNKDDTKAIYEAIEQHLVAWKSKLQYGINIGNAPVDDLMAMDQFANAVYDHAKHLLPREVIDSLLSININKRFKANNMLQTPTDKTKAVEESEGRNTMMDFLKSRVHYIKR